MKKKKTSVGSDVMLMNFKTGIAGSNGYGLSISPPVTDYEPISQGKPEGC